MEKMLTREEVAAIRDRLFSGEGMTSREQKAVMRYVEALESTPPHAPAQVGRFVDGGEDRRPDPDWHWCKGECGDLTFEGRGHEDWHRKHTGWTGGTTSATRVDAPTPPPGLREAVGRILRAWEQSREIGKPVELSLGTVESIRAAYDATGGEDWGTKMQDDLRAVLTLAQTGEAGDHQTPLGARAVAAVRALHEDAAKYRAAVEAITRCAKAAQADLSINGVVQLEPAGRMNACRDIARDLGLTLDMPPPWPGGGLRCEECKGKGVIVQMTQVCGLCNGKGHADVSVSTCGFTPKTAEDVAAFHEVTQATVRYMQTRARIAPTPTPETPPLESAPDTFQAAMRGAFLVLDQCDTEERQRWEKVLRMLEDAAPRTVSVQPSEVPPLEELPPREWSTFEPPPMPKPAAPVVVLDRDGVRVAVDGAGRLSVSVIDRSRLSAAVVTVARALAEAKQDHADDVASLQRVRAKLDEAKREADWARQNTRDVDRDRCSTINTLNREGVRDRQESFKRGAESMRERIARTLLDRRDALDSGKSRTHDGRRRGLEEAAAIARSTPVE